MKQPTSIPWIKEEESVYWHIKEKHSRLLVTRELEKSNTEGSKMSFYKLYGPRRIDV